MTQEEFLDQLESKSNCHGVSSFIIKLLKEDELPQAHSRFNIIDNILKKIKKIKTNRELIKNNIETVLENCEGYYIISLIQYLIREPDFKEIILSKLSSIILILNSKNTMRRLVVEMLDIGDEDLVEAFIKDINNIIPNIKGEDLFEVCRLLKESPSYNTEISNILDKELSSKRKKVSKYLLQKLGHDENARNRQINIDLLDMLLDELLENEETRMIDIDYIGKGSYSAVYKIGDKVLKIGSTRKTYQIPNHPRILQPLVRKNLLDEDGYKIGCIEISDFVKPIKKDSYEIEEELYQVYKELREKGLIWTDVNIRNVGRLEKDNSNLFYIKRNGDEPINVAPEAVGFQGELEDPILGEGELVILDTDYIYRDDDSEHAIILNYNAAEFEKRYKEEVDEEKK